MAFLFANNVNTTLAAAATNTQTTLSLTSTVGIPATIPSGDYFAMTLNDAATRSVFEVVYVTAVSGSNVTVLRAQEGTTANSWLSGDYIYGALTAGEISDFAFVSGSETQPFAVAPASASTPQNAPQFGQMFNQQQPSASGNITLSALRTVVIPTATSAITLTMQPGTLAGQWCEIVGTSYGVTVQSNVVSGNPVFTLPDGTNVYSFVLSTYGASLVLIWDGVNWRAQTIGQTVVAATNASNQAPPLSQIQAQFAALNGNANETFAVAATNASNQAPPLSQIQAQFAALNGNGNESFYAYELYADSLQGYGVFNSSNNSALVCNTGATGSVNYANNAYVPHECAPATNTSEAVTLGQFTNSFNGSSISTIIQRPDGVIEQWFQTSVSTGGSGLYSFSINFPEVFPAGCFGAVVGFRDSAPVPGSCGWSSAAANVITIIVNTDAAQTVNISIAAIGH